MATDPDRIFYIHPQISSLVVTCVAFGLVFERCGKLPSALAF